MCHKFVNFYCRKPYEKVNSNETKETIYYVTSQSSSGDKRFISVLQFYLPIQQINRPKVSHAKDEKDAYEFSNVLDSDRVNRQRVLIPVFLCLISYSPIFQFQENWLKIVYENLELSMMPGYLLNNIKQSRTVSDINTRFGKEEFPIMKRDFDFEQLTRILHYLESPPLNINLTKTEKVKAPLKYIEDSTITELSTSLINLISQSHKQFKDQLLHVSMNFSSYLTDGVPNVTNIKRNTQSMPMKCESLQNLNLNFPLVPDNHNYYKIFDYLSPISIINLFYGILLEERIVLVSDRVDKLTAVVEAIFELMFPFNPINYRTISFLPEDMTVFLGLPCPFVIGCTRDVFEVIQRQELKDFEDELMLIDIDNDNLTWKRKVEYPQPHTQYFMNTLSLLKQQ